MSAKAFQLDTKASEPLLALADRLFQAKKLYGKSYWSMVKEIYTLGWIRTRLASNEYFHYQLFNDERFSWEAKKTFMGRQGVLDLSKKTPHLAGWFTVTEDKLAMMAMLKGAGLLVPETQAYYKPHYPIPGPRHLTSADEIRKFLREEATYPLFGKPAASQQSLGVVSIHAYDASSDVLLMANDETLGLEDFIAELMKYFGPDAADSPSTLNAESGYLFQHRMEPHEDVVAIHGKRLSSVRMLVLIDQKEISLHRATWKIPAGNNPADNLWRSGNFCAGLDVDTGKVNFTAKSEGLQWTSVEKHPDTGTVMSEVVFPQWEKFKEVTFAAASCIPACSIQGWDVALTDRGPIAVEVQAFGGAPSLSQAGYETGLYQGRYKEIFDNIFNTKTKTLGISDRVRMFRQLSDEVRLPKPLPAQKAAASKAKASASSEAAPTAEEQEKAGSA